MDGTVFKIEEFSIYDGPGIRTTVFLKGCPMRCTWCHNPEGQKEGPETVTGIPGREGRMVGEAWSAAALAERLRKNERLLQNGGVTFSGGEPLLQADFVSEVIDLLHEEPAMHVAVQTAGNVPEKDFLKVLKKADFFLYDLKLMDASAHRMWTGTDNGRILANFEALVKSGVLFITRTPLIPGVTDTEDNIRAVAAFLQAHGVKEIELLPYNPMAGGKYASVGRTYAPGFPENKKPEPHLDLFKACGIKGAVL